MEPIAIPGSMASPLSSNRRRHVAGAMTNTHALRGTSPMSGPDIQAAYKEYERSFDELSQASAASPPLFKRRWGDGGVDDDDVSVLTAPVVHQQRRPSQRELERELVRADNAGRVTDHNSTATAMLAARPTTAPSSQEKVRRRPSRSSARATSASSRSSTRYQWPPSTIKMERRARALCEQAPARAQPRGDSIVSVVCELGLGRLGAGAGVDAAGADDQVSVVTAAASARSSSRPFVRVAVSRDLAVQVARDGVALKNVAHLQRHRHDGPATACSLEIAHFWGRALRRHNPHHPARARRAPTRRDVRGPRGLSGDATHLQALEEAVRRLRAAALKANGRRAPPRFGGCLTPEDALLPRTLRKASSGRARRNNASPRCRHQPRRRRRGGGRRPPGPTCGRSRRPTASELLKTFPRHWTDIEEHTTWGRPEKVRKDVRPARRRKAGRGPDDVPDAPPPAARRAEAVRPSFGSGAEPGVKVSLAWLRDFRPLRVPAPRACGGECGPRRAQCSRVFLAVLSEQCEPKKIC